MKSCQHSEKIVAYRLGSLTDKETREFEVHLKTCSACQQELKIESTIEKELSVELQPGFIEGKVLAHIKLYQARDMRSFWLYAFRMIVYGITAIIVGLIFIPLILKFPIDRVFDFIGLSTLTNQMVTSTNFALLLIGLGYILIFISTLYSFAHIRR